MLIAHKFQHINTYKEGHYILKKFSKFKDIYLKYRLHCTQEEISVFHVIVSLCHCYSVKTEIQHCVYNSHLLNEET
jgi:hypothetical protein